MKEFILSAIRRGKTLAMPKKSSKGRLGKLRREMKRLQKKLAEKQMLEKGQGFPTTYVPMLPPPIIGSGIEPKPVTVRPRCPVCGKDSRIEGWKCKKCFLEQLIVDTCDVHGTPLLGNGVCTSCREERRVKDEGLDPALAGVKRVIDL